MDDVVRAREAAREALADIEPDRLRSVLEERLTEASMAPAVLALRSARALDGGANLDAIAERAAGVQLIYEGLRLTRTLAHDEPWERLSLGSRAEENGSAPDGDESAPDAHGGASDAPSSRGAVEEGVAADLDVLAADVLVSRGFYLLARTDAADRAVETVRSFGRDQTLRRDAENAAGAAALDRNLEADVFALAAVAGATAVGRDPPSRLLEFAGDLAGDADDGGLPPVAVSLADATPERIAALSAGDDRVRSSATDS